MKVDRDFAPISPSETRDCGLDFSNDLAAGETIASATATLALISTLDGSTADTLPDTRKSGSPAIEVSLLTELTDAVIVQRVTGCLDGNTYDVILRATTSNGQVLELNGHLPCRVAA